MSAGPEAANWPDINSCFNAANWAPVYLGIEPGSLSRQLLDGELSLADFEEAVAYEAGIRYYADRSASREALAAFGREALKSLIINPPIERGWVAEPGLFDAIVSLRANVQAAQMAVLRVPRSR